MRFVFTCIALVKAGLSIGPHHSSFRLSMGTTFGVPSLCNLLLQKFSFLIIQTLHNDCSHIEDVHPIFCAHFMNIFSYLSDVELRHFSIKKMLLWYLVCVRSSSDKAYIFPS